MQWHFMNHSQRGFNWMKMLLTLGIVIFVGSLVVPGFNCRPNRVNHAKAGLQKIALAVRDYHHDTGLVPSSINALTSKPDSVANWKGPYMSEARTLDPWGTKHQYRAPGPGDRKFEVRSLGSDRAVGGTGDARDLSNWD